MSRTTSACSRDNERVREPSGTKPCPRDYDGPEKSPTQRGPEGLRRALKKKEGRLSQRFDFMRRRPPNAARKFEANGSRQIGWRPRLIKPRRVIGGQPARKKRPQASSTTTRASGQVLQAPPSQGVGRQRLVQAKGTARPCQELARMNPLSGAPAARLAKHKASAPPRGVARVECLHPLRQHHVFGRRR